MAEMSVERRRWPRLAVSGQARLDRTAAQHVRLIDISLGGVLMASSEPFDRRQYGRLTTRLGDVSIDVNIEVRRTCREREGKHAYKGGARFVGLDDETRQAMQKFLAAAKR